MLDSDGTVIFTHGKLTGGSLLTRKKAIQHDRPAIHMDMDKLNMDEAGELLESFISENGIEVLNVAGSRASRDTLVYEKTVQIIGKLLKF